jgi:hypothetical protein
MRPERDHGKMLTKKLTNPCPTMSPKWCGAFRGLGGQWRAINYGNSGKYGNHGNVVSVTYTSQKRGDRTNPPSPLLIFQQVKSGAEGDLGQNLPERT